MFSCRSSAYYKSQTKNIALKFERYYYQDIREPIIITVLLFNKAHSYDLGSFPNFMIGIDSNNRIIGILDINFHGKVERNSKILASPKFWTSFEKERFKPALMVYPRKKINQYYYLVDTIYYAEIIPITN